MQLTHSCGTTHKQQRFIESIDEKKLKRQLIHEKIPIIQRFG